MEPLKGATVEPMSIGTLDELDGAASARRRRRFRVAAGACALLFAATESIPKVVVIAVVLAQTGASVGLYLLIALAIINGVNTYDNAMIELLPELASVAPPSVGAVAARPTPGLALRGLVDRLVDTDTSTPESVFAAWRAASTVDNGQEEFHEAQLCVLLAAIVRLAASLRARACETMTFGPGRRSSRAASSTRPRSSRSRSFSLVSPRHSGRTRLF
mgnify:CR=1 FL=1